MARLIDTYARTFDVTDTRVVLVDASPAAVLAAGERLEIARTVGQAIEALGLADRLVIAPTRLEAREGEHVYGMAAGSVKVIWGVRVEPGPESGTTLSMTTRFVSTDHSSRRAAPGGLDRRRPGLRGVLQASPRSRQTVRRVPG